MSCFARNFTITVVPECPKFPLNKIPFFLNACNTKCVTHLILLRYSYHIILIYNIPGYEKSRNPDLDLSQIILADVADYALLDLVAATTMVRDKVLGLTTTLCTSFVALGRHSVLR